MGLWKETLKHPGAPPFAGGVLDSWPAYLVDAFSIADLELGAIESFRRQEAPRNA